MPERNYHARKNKMVKSRKKKDEAYSKRFKEKALGKQCRLKELTMYVSL